MARIIQLKEARLLPPGQLRYWVYNGLDCTGTLEIAGVLLPRMNERQRRIYGFERAQQGPAVQMMLRGVAVNEYQRKQMVRQLKTEITKDTKVLQGLPGIVDVWDRTETETGMCSADPAKRHKWPKGVPDAERKCERCGTARLKLKPFNPGSTHDKKHLFYDLHKVKPMLNKQKIVSTDGDVLLRIGKKHPELEHITAAIGSLQDKTKQLQMLEGRLSPDGRYMTSMNVGSAWTGRFSASKNPYQLGGNMQNITERNRVIFEADAGMLLGYSDLKQGESNAVAHYADDPVYIDAHLSGDTHTYVTRLLWPDMGWTGDLAHDKKIAKQLPEWDNVEGHDFRFQSKRVQHGSNFGLTPPGISMIAKIPVAQAAKAQGAYFKEFPFVRKWQREIAKDIAQHLPLVNAVGREIHLMGRPLDGHTIKQGLAFKPQSLIADILNLAMIRVFLELEPLGIQMLAQIHDALLFQFPREKLELARDVARLMQIPVVMGQRTMTIEAELAVGLNWGHKSPHNPDGIEEVKL